MKIKLRSLAAVFAVICVHIVMGSSALFYLKSHHDFSITKALVTRSSASSSSAAAAAGRSGQLRYYHSRKLLGDGKNRMEISPQNDNNKVIIGGGVKKQQSKKAVEQSVRTAPPSTSNPIQN